MNPMTVNICHTSFLKENRCFLPKMSAIQPLDDLGV
jgi:hypothetical protein